jgi:hypothetical protein
MMPPYPEKAILAGRHFMFALHDAGLKWPCAHPVFTALRGPVRLLKICKSTIFAN